MIRRCLPLLLILVMLIAPASAEVTMTTTFVEYGGNNYTVIKWTTDLAADGSGAFSVPASTGLLTGYAITETVSKAGYYTETFTIVPYVSEIIPQSVSLIPTTFDKYANGTISGLFRDQYGSSISTVGLTMTNLTGGILSTTSTTQGFYYFNNVPRMTTWNAVATKTGYANVSHVFEMGYYV